MKTTIYTAAITLFLVMDPIGNIPIFVSRLKNVDPTRRAYLILREACIALERLMGMVLTTLSVQMFLSGISEYFHLT